MDLQLRAVLDAVILSLGTNVRGVYLYGSAVEGGLRPASDLDLLVVVDRPTSKAEGQRLVEQLTPVSSRRLRPSDWRPIELTVVVGSDVRPWRYPPRMDLQFGEWLRPYLDAGGRLESSVNPDLAILIAMVLLASRPLIGPPASELLDDPPWSDVVRSMRHGIPDLLGDLDSDTTNVLLTLARICCTLETCTFVSKDAAADWAMVRFPDGSTRALARARADYLGEVDDSWNGSESEARAAADLMAEAALKTEP